MIRIVEGVSGSVRVRSELVIRFDYGSVVPWVRRVDGRWLAVAGPDGVETRGLALEGDRDDIRKGSCRAVLALLGELIGPEDGIIVREEGALG